MWPPIGKLAAHSAYKMFSWYQYLIVDLVFFPPRLLEWESFSDCTFCLPVPFHRIYGDFTSYNRLL